MELVKPTRRNLLAELKRIKRLLCFCNKNDDDFLRSEEIRIQTLLQEIEEKQRRKK